jgi:adenylate cyclase class IV
MDTTCEIEAKFSADGVPVVQVMTFATNKKHLALKDYRVVEGVDQYWGRGDHVVRLRIDGPGDCTLTVKQRKSANQILERHEVDLPLQPGVPSPNVERFLELSGWERLFTISKTSHIWRFQYADHAILLALYDVFSGKTRRRFMEVEVDKDSACSKAHAHTVLKNWISSLQTEFGFKSPLNKSLLELYGPTK